MVVNVGIEIDSSFNLIGRIRGPNVSAGALCLIVTRLVWTLILDLERLIFISKDLQFSCHIHSVWHHHLHVFKASVTMLIMISHPLHLALYDSLVKTISNNYDIHS